MSNTQEILIKDGNSDKKFTIKKFSAMESFFFVNKIISIIASSKINGVEENEKNSIIDLIKNMSKMDNTVDEKDSKEKNKAEIDINSFMPILIKILKGAIAATDEDARNDIYNTLLKQCYNMNGISIKQLNLYNCDEFLEDFKTIFKLIFESVKFNFGFFLKEIK